MTEHTGDGREPGAAAGAPLKKIEAGNGCAREKIVAAPRCLHVNAEDFCP